MKRLLLLMLFNGLVIIGVHEATGPGEIGEDIGRFAEKKLPPWIAKPLVSCPPCQASVWGSAIYWLFGPRNLLLWIPYVLALSGAMRLFVRLPK